MKKLFLSIALCYMQLTIYSMQQVPSQGLQIAASIGKNILPQHKYQITQKEIPQIEIKRNSIDQVLKELEMDTQKLKIDQQAWINPKVFSQYHAPYTGSKGLFNPTKVTLQAKQKAFIPEPRSIEDAKKILNLTSSSPTEKEIKVAFNKKAMQAHPDTGGSNQDFLNLQKARDLLLGKQSPISNTDTKAQQNRSGFEATQKDWNDLNEALKKVAELELERLFSLIASASRDRFNFNEYYDQIKKLLKSPLFDINNQRYGETALLKAIGCESKAEIISLLLEHKANPNIKNSYGSSALLLSTYVLPLNNPDSAKIIQLLIDHKANVNDQNNEGNTALMYIVHEFLYGFMNKPDKNKMLLKIMQILIDNGSDIHLKNNAGQSALDIALKAKNPIVLKILSPSTLDLLKLKLGSWY